jgi:hypothetical protein
VSYLLSAWRQIGSGDYSSIIYVGGMTATAKVTAEMMLPRTSNFVAAPTCDAMATKSTTAKYIQRGDDINGEAAILDMYVFINGAMEIVPLQAQHQALINLPLQAQVNLPLPAKAKCPQHWLLHAVPNSGHKLALTLMEKLQVMSLGTQSLSLMMAVY